MHDKAHMHANLANTGYPFNLLRLQNKWEFSFLKDIFSEIQSGFAEGKHNKDIIGIPHMRPMNINTNGDIDISTVKYVSRNSNVLRLENLDILFNNTNSAKLIGKTALVKYPEEWAFSNHMTRIRLPEELNSYFFAKQLHYLWMTGFFKRKCVNHVNQASISTKELAENIPILVAPRAEQDRIVAKIEELFSNLDAGIAALERVKAKLTRYRASLLKAAVEGRLTEKWRAENPPAETGEQLLQRILRERREQWEKDQLAAFKAKGQKPPKNWQAKYKEPVAPDTKDLPALPLGWCWANLGQCFTISVGATPSRSELSYWGGDIPWVSSGEVQFCTIEQTREYITEAGLANSSTRINPKGSILLGMIGEGRTRGQAAILNIDAANNQNCAAIWVSKTDIPLEYIYYFFVSNYEKTRRESSGNNQPALNKSIVELITFPLPPLAEMTTIKSLLHQSISECEVLISRIMDNLNRTIYLRQTILKKAFEGKLVAQDPNDEPAAVLLERIRQEREASGAPKTRKTAKAPRGRKKKTQESDHADTQ